MGVARTGEGIGSNGTEMSKGTGSKRLTQRDKFLATIVIVFTIVYMLLMASVRISGGRCCDSTLVSSSFIRQTITYHTLDSMDGLPPRTVGMMLMDDTLGEHVFDREEYFDSLDTVLIRGKTLRSILSDTSNREAMKAELQLPENNDAWESLGRFRFSLETEIYDSYEPHVIVAVSCYEEEGVLVGFADIHIDTVNSIHDLREMIEIDRVAREANGFAPLEIDVENEIADYRSAKKLDAFVD